jgi:hypothetical protein
MAIFYQLPGLDAAWVPVDFEQDEKVPPPTTATPSKMTEVKTKPALAPLQIPLRTLSERSVPATPPRDHGWAAYRTLLAATIVTSFPCGKSQKKFLSQSRLIIDRNIPGLRCLPCLLPKE